MNSNVFNVLCLQPAQQLCTSLATNTQISAYLLLRTGSQAKVGLAVGAQGAANLVAAFPGAWMADRYGREIVIRTAMVFGVVGYACLVWAVWAGLAPSPEFLAISGALALIGTQMGTQSSSVEALFGDSVASGSRSSLYALKASLRIMGSAAGPLVAVCAFAYLGDDWKAGELRWCLSIGAVFFAVPCFFALRLSEKNSLGASSQALIAHSSSSSSSLPEKGEAEEDPAAKKPSEAELTTTDDREETPAEIALRNRIAFTVVSSDLLMTLGAGLSIKFVPLFLLQRCHLSPIAVNLIGCVGPLGAAGAAMLAQKASTRFGRLQVTLAARVMGILCLIGMATIPSTYGVVALYIFRVFMVNCGTGLTKSVLNDYVTKKERARWNSAEAINSFGWSGSATIGGFIIESQGYRPLFLVTAAVQFVAGTFLLTILHLVHNEVKEETPKDLAEPLLKDEEKDDESSVGPRSEAGYSLLNFQGHKADYEPSVASTSDEPSPSSTTSSSEQQKTVVVTI